ncbi:hypothetical protein CONLIGDRAFT_709712 [Coniochaeta ligniaria NRRL 30616]|uniref:Uncharacterized protein n=1 Tax=Coniochaeta ligniaria NRRL 30616 TaxID=1408157 RepID=A0A1J7J4I5_9PEZI|nr:hypothetical protein CONLIGDRAFT_709712 [Coniochaeta ligniaria NRRL 30616]
MFVAGFFVAEHRLFTSQASSPTAATVQLDNATASVRANKTAIIDGVEVLGTQCGSNWQEAKAMGCHFDVMASRWYSTECFDQEVLDDMLAEPQVNWNFTWYADHEHTIVVPPEKVFRGEFDKVYPNNLFHIKHCLHLWRKLHHAVLTSRPVDEDILDYDHTIHCTKMIMDWVNPGFKRHSVTTAKSATPFSPSFGHHKPSTHPSSIKMRAVIVYTAFFAALAVAAPVFQTTNTHLEILERSQALPPIEEEDDYKKRSQALPPIEEEDDYKKRSQALPPIEEEDDYKKRSQALPPIEEEDDYKKRSQALPPIEEEDDYKK